MTASGRPGWPVVSALLYLGLDADAVVHHVGMRALEAWRRHTGGVVKPEAVPSWAWYRTLSMVGDLRRGAALQELHRARARQALARYNARERARRY